ncbi:MAGUK p55 subfamily member 7 [Bagarius yarrelli]|uniref:MAGUK p55 subfamily member 7 n=1 Tax=Bagarius yarrelli TaxID=175774 RepID=A0A556TNC5_BAGYA|nr:MAGUK p55 subfamily member 7 [Bagarius yarrelli]
MHQHQHHYIPSQHTPPTPTPHSGQHHPCTKHHHYTFNRAHTHTCTKTSPLQPPPVVNNTTHAPNITTTPSTELNTTHAPNITTTPPPVVNTTHAPNITTTPSTELNTTHAPNITTTPPPVVNTTHAPNITTTPSTELNTTHAQTLTTTTPTRAQHYPCTKHQPPHPQPELNTLIHQMSHHYAHTSAQYYPCTKHHHYNPPVLTPPTNQISPLHPNRGSTPPCTKITTTTPPMLNQPLMQPNITTHTPTGAQHPPTPHPNITTTTPTRAQHYPPTCPATPCPPLFECVNSVCECLPGTYFSEGQCIEGMHQRTHWVKRRNVNTSKFNFVYIFLFLGKVFPGVLHLINENFTMAMNDPNSEEFQKMANKITKSGSVVATVNNVFQFSSTVTGQAVSQTIQDNVPNGSYKATDLCTLNPCDPNTTKCSGNTDGTVTCTCMPGYVSAGYSTKICLASLLALVIVAVVLGAILLFLILALIIFCVCCRTKGAPTLSSPYAGDEFQIWPNQNITPIPRASLGNNAYSEPYGIEMPMPDIKKPTNGLMGSYDLMPLEDMKTFKGKNPPRYSSLVEGLHETLALLTSQLRPDANHKEDMVFLRDVFSERSLAYLMKVAEELQSGPMSVEEKELLHLLTSPHLRALLSVHDTVAQKNFDPVLPPLPEDFDDELEEDSVKIVRLVKNKEPLGATIRRDESTGAVVVARIMKGGAADRSGLVHVGDELREVNGISSQSQGSITLKVEIIPAVKEEDIDRLKESRVFMRALFDYLPLEDKATPCQEAGLPFRRGDILQVVSQDDATWWQAKRVGDSNLRAGLVPSKQFQERRLAYRHKMGSLPNSKSHKQTAWSLGARINELKQKVIAENPHRYAVAVPHTTRPRKSHEKEGVEYHFVSKQAFETDAQNNKFIEYGEYKDNQYGTSIEAIRSVQAKNKMCLVDVQPEEEDLQEMRQSAQQIEQEYGHLVDRVLIKEDSASACVELRTVLERLERETFWVPVSWVRN